MDITSVVTIRDASGNDLDTFNINPQTGSVDVKRLFNWFLKHKADECEGFTAHLKVNNNGVEDEDTVSIKEFAQYFLLMLAAL